VIGAGLVPDVLVGRSASPNNIGITITNAKVKAARQRMVWMPGPCADNLVTLLAKSLDIAALCALPCGPSRKPFHSHFNITGQYGIAFPVG